MKKTILSLLVLTILNVMAFSQDRSASSSPVMQDTQVQLSISNNMTNTVEMNPLQAFWSRIKLSLSIIFPSLIIAIILLVIVTVQNKKSKS